MRRGALPRVGLLLAAWLGGSGCLHTASRSALTEQLDREIMALKAKNDLLGEAAAACEAERAVPPVSLELKQVFAGTEVTVQRDGPRTEVIIPSALLFATNSVQLRAEAAMVLDLLATALKLHPELQILIVGHTDDAPLGGSMARQYGDLWSWSAALAASVMVDLRDKHEVAADRFTIAGRGAASPVAENDTPAGRAQNRRVVVVLSPGGEGE